MPDAGWRLAVAREQALKDVVKALDEGRLLRTRAKQVGEALADPNSIETIVGGETLEKWIRDKDRWVKTTGNMLEDVFETDAAARQFRMQAMSLTTSRDEGPSRLTKERKALQQELVELERVAGSIEALGAPKLPQRTEAPREQLAEERQGVFVSHAYADKALVTPFVNLILRLGSGLPMDRLFYTSGAATGVPAGADLNTHVRDKVAQAGLVVAIITPTFRTRPYCMAELGAAWSRVGRLFPFLLPGMSRDELDGVLSGLGTPYLDDSAALDQLHDKVTDLAASKKSSADWGQHKAEWLDELRTQMKAAAS